jgi:predicted ribosome quality control (RQC) complex YloA/Tae2 family protein
VDLAERQILEGTASAQVITHFLKLASTREKLEQQRLKNENALLEAKRETMASSGRIEELYEQALLAMRSYQGIEEVIDDPEG